MSALDLVPGHSTDNTIVIETEGSTDGIPQKHKGAWAEAVAAAWLMSQGYEVFHNASQHGSIDLIAIKGSDCLKLDVKLARFGSEQGWYSKTRTEEQKQLGVQILNVRPNGECRIVNHQD